LDDLSGGYRASVNPGARLVVGSITDQDLVESLFAEYAFDYVYHLAAYAAEGLSHFIRCFNYTNNLVGSMSVINAALRHKAKCLVFTSSIAVYGSGQTPMVESLAPHPEDPYGVAKYAVELDLAAARRIFGLNYIVFRPHNVYGERQNIADRYRNVVGIFMNSLLQKRPCTIFGDGTQTRAFTHVSDVAPLIARSVDVASAYGQVFNVGSDIPVSINHLAAAVKRAMGCDYGTEYLSSREEVRDAFSSHAKCETTFAQRATVDLETGLARMAAWVRTVGARKTKDYENIEVIDRLPDSWRPCKASGELPF
jgi:UDP-glucose 4-epimerase